MIHSVIGVIAPVPAATIRSGSTGVAPGVVGVPRLEKLDETRQMTRGEGRAAGFIQGRGPREGGAAGSNQLRTLRRAGRLVQTSWGPPGGSKTGFFAEFWTFRPKDGRTFRAGRRGGPLR
jgi:hypothetical protein